MYALYGRSRKVKLFLSSVFLYELVSMIYMAVLVNRRFAYDDTCLLKETPKEALGLRSVGHQPPRMTVSTYCLPVFFSITPIITQVIIWGMTWYRQASIRVAPTSTPIVNVVFRDGLITFTVVCCKHLSFCHVTTFSDRNPIRSVIFSCSASYTFFVHVLTHSIWS